MNVPFSAWYSARPLVFGHRGARAYAPMNTLPSFELALEQGADGVELDVQLTKDGKLVVIHDFTVDGTTDGKGAVKDLTFDEIRRLDAGVRFDDKFRGTRIPTLEEVFALMGGTALVNVEIKAPFQKGTDPESTDGVERAVADCVLAAGMENRVIVSSFNPLTLRRFRAALPSVPLAFLYAKDVPFDTPSLMTGIPHEAYHPHYKLATRETVAAEHAAGRFVNVWTVNEPEDARQLLESGVDGLITDKPDIIRESVGR